ncbi:MAG: ATP-dependent helicase, partial [Pseudomonadota bacterium]
ELIATLKYYVTLQSRMGDRHVYGAKSRFLTRKVMACFEETCWSDEKEKSEIPVKSTPLDVAAKLRGMWA